MLISNHADSLLSSEHKKTYFYAFVTNGCECYTGNLLYTVATKVPANALMHRPTTRVLYKNTSMYNAHVDAMDISGEEHRDIFAKEELECGFESASGDYTHNLATKSKGIFNDDQTCEHTLLAFTLGV
ncbi:hypothetical protein QVD17_30688 [Tagetes erecta]|uniref:Uncharacterized protein n=1 Tax=Tagetes erecta TaxID=13708 RepID=A0AAD8K433_TARER|nr:hypothetical protein QVD17_30688 [Tagetes erecta]